MNRIGPLFAGVAIALALIAGSIFMWRTNVGRASARPDGLKPVLHTSAAVIPAVPGRVAINAFPWGEVTAIKNVATGKIETIQPTITPAPLDLAPGKYEITLSNPAFRSPITQVVDVRAGEDQLVNVHFTDPESAKLPAFQ